MKDKVETLEEILTRYSGGPGRNDLHLMNGPTFQNMLRQEDGILQYIPAVKELQEEVERLKDKLADTTDNLHFNQDALRAAYKEVDRLTEQLQESETGADETVSDMAARIATLEAQLAGGEAVMENFAVTGFAFVNGFKHDSLPIGAKLYTAAPAIKQQVAEGWREAIDGLMDFSPDNRGPLPGMIRGGDYIRKDEVISTLERLTPTHPVSANQPDGGKVPEPAREVIDALHEVTISLDSVVKQIVDDGCLPTPRLWERLNKAKAVCAKNPRFEGNFDYPASDFKFQAPSPQSAIVVKVTDDLARKALHTARDLIMRKLDSDWQTPEVVEAIDAALAASPSAPIAEGDK